MAHFLPERAFPRHYRLANDLHVSRTTVVTDYAELEAT